LAILIFMIATLVVVAWLLRQPLFSELRRQRIKRVPFPAAWRDVLRQRIPYFYSMPVDLQLQLKKRIQVFLAEKPFIGCAGLVVTDEMRVTIAAQACLLILNRRNSNFDSLRQILVYPNEFIVDKTLTDRAGLSREERQVLTGESWSLGQVILSWKDVVEGAAAPHDGKNVVIHEFAHQLDQEGGRANGAPWMPGKAAKARWARVLSQEYAALQRRTLHGTPSLLSSYGASNPAEFFAVASEVFFEQPDQLANAHAALYRELSGFYRVNPLSW
jgi:Mlc titration factor MtfA (ptsG expression regulator)